MKSIFCVIVFAALGLPSFSAQAGDARRASLLANNISFLSAHTAKDYLESYQNALQDCLEGTGDDSESRRACVETAIDRVRELAAPQFEGRIFREHIDHLRREGHISRYLQYPDREKVTVGVAGDSMAVGAMAAQHLDTRAHSLVRKAIFNFLVMGQNTTRADLTPLIGQIGNLPARRVLRIFDTPLNSKTGLERYGENKGSKFTDCEECSFAYTIARNLGAPPSNVFFAGQSGKRVSSLDEQLDRLALPLGYLPDKVIVSYTGNDICHPNNQNVTAKEKYDEYYSKMKSIIEDKLKNLQASRSGTEFLIVAAADIDNLLTNPHILSKKIRHFWPAGPEKVYPTCADLRTQSLGGAAELAQMCPYILETDPNDQARIEHIKSLHRAVVKAQSDVVKALSASASLRNYSFSFTDAILDVNFRAEDISPDCFHPSTNGHDKIAEAILREL